MEIAADLSRVKETITNGDTAAALTQLIRTLEGKAPYEGALRSATLLNADYKRLKDLEIAGAISANDLSVGFNRINYQLLELIEQIENGGGAHFQSGTGDGGSRRGPLPYVLGTIGVAGLAALLYFLWPRPQPPATPGNQGNQGTTPTDTEYRCPDFSSNSAFNVLLLPFDRIRGEQQQPEVAIRNKVEELGRKTNISVDAECANATINLSDDQKLRDLKNRCRVRMVLSGQYETNKSDSTLIALQYKLTDTLRVPQILLQGEDQLRTASLLGIDASGSFFTKIENVIRLVLGLVAYSENKHQEAVNALSGISAGNGTSDTTLHMLLGSSYYHLKQYDNAIKEYDAYTSNGGKNTLPLNNLAFLHYKQGDYDAVIKTTEKTMTNTAKDSALLLVRAGAMIKKDRIDEAKAVLSKAEKYKVNPRSLQEKNKMIDLRLNEIRVAPPANELKTGNGATSKVERKLDPGKVALFRETEEKNALQDLRTNPAKRESYVTLMKIYEAREDKAKLEEIKKQAQRQGVQLEKTNTNPELLKRAATTKKNF